MFKIKQKVEKLTIDFKAHETAESIMCWNKAGGNTAVYFGYWLNFEHRKVIQSL